MIKIVVFDLDGTLVNSLTDLALCVNKGLKCAGLPEHSEESYRYFVGNGREMLVKRAMGQCDDEHSFKLVWDTFNREYSVHCNDNTSSYKDCDKLLEKLSRMGILTAVLSNKPDEFVGGILKKLYPNHSFSLAWGKKPEYAPKPDSASLLAMLRLYNIVPDECIYIGDSDVDVVTAKNAGVKMAGVSWGFRGRDELVGVGAPFVADTAEELFEYICDLNE